MNKLVNVLLSIVLIFGVTMTSTIPVSAEYTPTISIISPFSTSDWAQGSSQTIRWRFSGVSGKLKIDLYHVDSGDNLTYDYTVRAAPNVTARYYKWSIPWTQAAGTYRIKLTSLKNTAIFAYSQDFLISPAYITLTQPNGGLWAAGTSNPISWISNANTGTLTIDLYKGETLIRTITRTRSIGSKGTGTYNWTVPSTTETGSDYWIKITSNSVPEVTDSSDSFFTISRPLSVTSPSGGEYWGVRDTHYITWNHSASLTGYVKIELTKAGRLKKVIKSRISINSTPYTWVIPYNLVAGSDYQIKITSLTNRSVIAYSEPFTIQKQAIMLTSPNDNVTWRAGTNHDITWNVTTLTGNVEIVLFDGLFYQKLVATDVPAKIAPNIYSGTYSWTVPGDVPPGVNYRIRVSSMDNLIYFDTSDEYFSITGGSSTATLLSSDNITYGESVTDTATVTVSGGTATGNITFQVSTGGDNWTTYDTKVLSSGSATSDAYTPPSAGNYWFRAIYGGGGPYEGSQSGDTEEPLEVFTKDLTVSGITAVNKVYNGTDNATLNYGTAALVGVVGSDDVTLNTAGIYGNFPSSNVGDNLTVTIAGLSLDGTDKDNYDLTQPTATASITVKGLTGTFTVSNKEYDGNTSATLTGSNLTGIVGSENVTLTGTPVFVNAAVGDNKTVIMQSPGLSGTDSSNYVLNSVDNTTANITAKGLTLNGVYADNLTYNGATAATLHYDNATFSGVITPDVVTLVTTGATANFANKNVGADKSITVDNLTLGGPQATNYTLTQPDYVTADILAKHVTATFTADNKTYDGDNTTSMASFEIDGKVTGDNLTLTGTPTFDNVTVGTEKNVFLAGAGLSGDDSGNYVLDSVDNTTADINPMPLTATFTADNKIYNGDNTTTMASSNLFTPVGGDDVTLTGTPTFDNVTVGTGKNVFLAGADLSGDDAGNYTLTSVDNTTADITALHLTGTFTVENMTYNGTTTTTIATSNLDTPIGGDNVTLTGTPTFDNATVGTGKVVQLVNPDLAGDDAGNYILDSVDNTTADITPLAITATFTVDNKVYDGDNTTEIASSNLYTPIGGDNVTLTGTPTFDNATVGTGKVVQLVNPDLTGDDAGNYTLTSVDNTTADITAKELTVSGVEVENKTYSGDTVAVLIFDNTTLEGVIVTDTVNLVTAAYVANFDNATVGTDKPVTISGLDIDGADSGNYSLTQPDSVTGIILPKDVTATFTAENKTYDGDNTTNIVTFIINGKVGEDNVTLTGTATFDNATVGTEKVVVLVNPGLTGDDAGNYNLLSVENTTADITAKVLTATGLDAVDRTYDGTVDVELSVGSAGLDGVVGSDDVSLDTTLADGSMADKNVGTAKEVTIDNLTLSGSAAGNYSLATPVTVDVDIAQMAITVTAQSDNKTADGTASSDETPVITPGLAAGDSSGFYQVYDNATAGTGKTLSVMGAVNDGNSGNNYAVTPVDNLTGVIMPDVIDNYTLTTEFATYGTGESFVVTITAYDQYGNVCTDNSTALVTLTADSDNVTFTDTYGPTDDNITQLSNGVTTVTVSCSYQEDIRITATDEMSKTGYIDIEIRDP